MLSYSQTFSHQSYFLSYKVLVSRGCHLSPPSKGRQRSLTPHYLTSFRRHTAPWLWSTVVLVSASLLSAISLTQSLISLTILLSSKMERGSSVGTWVRSCLEHNKIPDYTAFFFNLQVIPTDVHKGKEQRCLSRLQTGGRSSPIAHCSPSSHRN